MVTEQIEVDVQKSRWFSALNGVTLKVRPAFNASDKVWTYRLAYVKNAWHLTITYRDSQSSQRMRLQLDPGEVADRGIRLSTARISAIPEEVFGCDGDDYALTFKSGLSSVTYHYWSAPSPGYEPVVDFGDWLMSKEPDGWWKRSSFEK